MLWHVARFEFGQHLRSLSTWLSCTLFGAIAYLLCIAAAGAFESVNLGLGTGGDVHIHRLALGAQSNPSSADRTLHFHTFALPTPLAAGAATTLDFDLEYAPRGFTNDRDEGMVVLDNGSFIVNTDYLPHIGYSKNFRELTDADERRKRGLPPRPRMADVEDAEARQNTFFTDADWLTLAATACTSADQVALMPGTGHGQKSRVEYPGQAAGRESHPRCRHRSPL
jgi:hypothetical protein